MTPKFFQDNLVGLQDKLLNFAFMLTSNRDDAYDLLQDTTLKVLDNQNKYVDNVNFNGWVFTIMRNIFINKYRRIARSTTVVDTPQDLFLLKVVGDTSNATPDGSYAVAEINAAINSFPDDYRLPLSMHITGYKYAEIAEKMNLPLGTVKSRIYFARQRLHVMLRDYRPS